MSNVKAVLPHLDTLHTAQKYVFITTFDDEVIITMLGEDGFLTCIRVVVGEEGDLLVTENFQDRV